MNRGLGKLVATALVSVGVAACGASDRSKTATGGTEALDIKLSFEGIAFDVKCANRSSLNELRVIPTGLEIVNEPIAIQVDGIARHAEVADLNEDGSPELYVFVTSAGSGSYGTLAAWAANNRKSLSQIYVPELDSHSREGAGYMGHDEFSIKGSSIVRRFPIYLEGDVNAAPSGKTREIRYELVAGEAGLILEPQEATEY